MDSIINDAAIQSFLESNNFEGAINEFTHLCDKIEKSVQTLKKISVTDVHNTQFEETQISFLLKVYKYCFYLKSNYAQEQLEGLGPILSKIFRLTFGLQKLFLEKMNLIEFRNDADNLVRLRYLNQNLPKLCEASGTLDNKATISIWKTFAKLLNSPAQAVETRACSKSIIGILSQQINANFVSLKDCVEKEFDDMIRILGFQLKVLINISNSMKYDLDDFACLLVEMVISIFKFSMQEMEPDSQQKVRNSICFAVNPLLMLSSEKKHFVADLVSSFNQSEFQDVFLFLVSIKILTLETNVDSLPLLIDFLYDNIDSYVFYCPVYILEPTYTWSEDADDVALDDFFFKSLQKSIEIRPSEYFNYLEQKTFLTLFSSKPMASLLANQLLVYIGSRLSDDYCYDLCIKLSQTIPKNSSESYELATTCLVKLINSLQPLYLNKFLNVYPVDTNLHIWSHLSSQSKLTHIDTQFLNAQNPQQILTKLKILESCLDRKCIKFLNDCWKIPVNMWGISEELKSIAQQLMQTTSKYFIHFQINDIVNILNCIEEAISQFPEDYIKLSLLDLLKELGSLRIPNTFQQHLLLDKIVKLLVPLISSEHVLIKLEAFTVFSIFARHCPHSEVIVKCIEQCESITPQIKDYIAKNFPEFSPLMLG